MKCSARAERRANLKYLASKFGAHVASTPVCKGHSAPLDFLESWVYDRPALSLLHGPRGGGKSYLAALATHLDSVQYSAHATRILGGSLAQSEQIYNALKDFIRPPAPPLIRNFTKTHAEYHNDSDVRILAATSTSVRGPHIPSLRLDEVDEIDPEIRESAMGMNMARNGVPAMCSMGSTWHRVGGPMGELIEKGRAGEFPTWSFCAFEILERCPESRSGPNLERCPECPLMKWCHEGIDEAGSPKAKRSDGHYTIEALIQKVRAVSLRIFEADYLCLGPKADGLWFKGFDPRRHVTEAAEYDPAAEAFLAVDPGVHTGGVWFQFRDGPDGAPLVTAFADYYAENLTAERNALEQRRISESRCNGTTAANYCDPAGGARNPIGPTVIQTYAAAGLHLQPWSKANPSVADGLEFLEGALCPANGKPRLLIHPRCVNLIRAFQSYRRARRAGQWLDRPEDPQHPAEDLIDALRGGCYARRHRRVLREL